MTKNKIIIISGPTASGKSGLGLELAKKINGVIINADSMQVYKGLPILSAQPNLEEQKQIPHFLYSVLEPTQNCSVGIWLDLVKNEIEKALAQNQVPIIVGGTGMYISKLIDGISLIPEVSEKVRKETSDLYEKIGYEEFYKLAKNIDEIAVGNLNKNDKQRLTRVYEVFQETNSKLSDLQKLENQKLYEAEQFFHININPKSREQLYDNCNKRFIQMLENSAIEEVESFMQKYPEVVNKTLGLEELILLIQNKISKQEAIKTATQKTRNYAKRQLTWFRNQFDKKNLEIGEVVNKDNITRVLELIKK